MVAATISPPWPSTERTGSLQRGMMRWCRMQLPFIFKLLLLLWILYWLFANGLDKELTSFIRDKNEIERTSFLYQCDERTIHIDGVSQTLSVLHWTCQVPLWRSHWERFKIVRLNLMKKFYFLFELDAFSTSMLIGDDRSQTNNHRLLLNAQ